MTDDNIKLPSLEELNEAEDQTDLSGKTKIAVFIEGGCVSGILCEHPELVEVAVVDLDVANLDENNSPIDPSEEVCFSDGQTVAEWKFDIEHCDESWIG